MGRVRPADVHGPVTHRVRLATGLVSTATFLVLGLWMLGEQHTGVAAVLLAIGAFRGAWLAKEWMPWE